LNGNSLGLGHKFLFAFGDVCGSSFVSYGPSRAFS
jgi:hypothetical protein